MLVLNLLFSIGLAQSTSQTLAYPDLFTLAANISNLAPKALESLNHYSTNNEPVGSQSSINETFEAIYSDWQNTKTWMSPRTAKIETEINYVLLPSEWTSANIKSLTWSLGFDVSNDISEQKDIVKKVLSWLEHKDKLRMLSTVFLTKVTARNKDREESARAYKIPLIVSWLQEDFLFLQVSKFSLTMNCKLAACLYYQEGIQHLVLSILGEYEHRIAAIINGLSYFNYYEDPMIQKFQQTLDILKELNQSSSLPLLITPNIVEKVRMQVSQIQILSEDELFAQMHLLKVLQLQNEFKNSPLKHLQNSSEYNFEDSKSYKDLEKILRNDIEISVEYLENLFFQSKEGLI